MDVAMTNVNPPQALTSVPGCTRSRLQQLATTQAVIGVVMTDAMPPQALSSVPGCMCNRMQQHATAKM